MTPTPTPGPWGLNTQDTGLNDSGTILGAGIVIVPDIYGRSKAESDANARLIAAAPELLEALKGLTVEAAALCAWRREQDNPDEETEYWIDKAHAVIARAEGGKP